MILKDSETNTANVVEAKPSIKNKIGIAVAAAITLGQSALFATTTSTGTILGKMTTYAAGDLWGTVGSIIGVGLPVAAGAWKMSETGQLKHLGYGVAAGVVMGGAFKLGPDLYQYMSAHVF